MHNTGSFGSARNRFPQRSQSFAFAISEVLQMFQLQLSEPVVHQLKVLSLVYPADHYQKESHRLNHFDHVFAFGSPQCSQ